jgi:hypothetical protein
VLVCLLVERWASRAPPEHPGESSGVRSDRRVLVLGVVVGIATWLRTLCWLVVPAALLVRAAGIRSRPELAAFLRTRALPLVLVSVGIALPWTIRNALHHPPWPAEQTLFATYGSAMWHTDPSDPGSPRVPLSDVLARPGQRTPQLLVQLGSRLDPSASGTAAGFLGLLLVGALVLAAVRRRGVPEITAFLGFVVLVFFPMPPEVRHLLPVWVLGMAAVADALLLALLRLLAPARARALATLALLALACGDLAPRWGWGEIAASYAADRELAARVAEHLRPEDRVAAPIGWHWSLFLDRPVYNLHIQARRMGTAGIDQVIRDRSIDAVILRVDPPEAPNTTAYIEAKYGAGETVGPVRIVRIRK